MATAIFGFGLTHAPDKDSESVRKYWQLWKVTHTYDRDNNWQALTPNGRFGKMAALLSLKNFTTFAAGCSLENV
jgi:hypothetical protein